MSSNGYVDVDGGTLYFEHTGDGPAIVLIAGGCLDVRMYEPQVEAFSTRHSFVRCDLRGFGRSSDPTDTAYRHCDDLRRLLEQLEIESACIGGQSFGGTVALDFAFAHPEMVRGLVLAPALPLLGWEWVEGFPVAPAIEAGLSGGMEAFRSAFLELPLTAGSMAVDDAAASLRRMLGDYSGWHLRNRDPVEFEAPDAADRLREVVAPTLVLVGENDVLDSRLVAERLARDLARAEHHVIDGAGHAPNLEVPVRFNGLVLDFLDRI